MSLSIQLLVSSYRKIMSKLLIFFCIVCAICSVIDSARILAVFPVPSISHQVVFRPLMHELVKRGHEVVVITTDPAFPKGQSPQNLTEIDVHDLSYKIWNDFLETGKFQANFSPMQMKIIFELVTVVFEAQVKSEGVQKLVNDKDKSFDLLFVESCVRPALSFAHVYNVPIIGFSSLGGIFGSFDETGASTNPLVYPIALRQRIYNLSSWEKLWELYNDYTTENQFYKQEEMENKIVRSIFGPKVPNLSELRKNVHMLFLNVHPIWDFNRPVPPNVIYLGGIHQKPDKELPKDLKTYLDSSKNGVIYISFGTNARPSLLPPEKLKIFTNVFSQLPYDILWKWDKDDLPGRSKNIKISKWWPQSDLLKHPKVKLFITQGGLQSTDEALAAGVPLIVIPFLGDQWFNAEQYVKLYIGIHLDIETITEDKLKNAIQAIVKNKTYRENVIRLYKLMRDQPQSPLERAVWWTEHVLRHGGATHLRSAAAHMHWTEYYAVDLILLLSTVLLTLFMGVVFVIRFVIIKLKPLRLKRKTKLT